MARARREMSVLECLGGCRAHISADSPQHAHGGCRGTPTAFPPRSGVLSSAGDRPGRRRVDRRSGPATGARRRAARRHGADRHARHDPERHDAVARRQDRRGRRQRRRFRPAPRSSTSRAGSSRPGIIDAHSHIAADSINEGGTTVSSMTGMEDVLDPTDINIYRDLAGGADDRQRAARQRQPDRRQELRSSSCAGARRAPRSCCSKARCRASSSRSARTRRTCRRRQLRAQPDRAAIR